MEQYTVSHVFLCHVDLLSLQFTVFNFLSFGLTKMRNFMPQNSFFL